MEQPTLEVTHREGAGSAVAKKLRRHGRIPAILYGHGTPENVSIAMQEFRTRVQPQQYGSMMVNVNLDGADIGTALVKKVQTNPMQQQILHVDLQRVSQSDEVTVDVEVVLVGDPAGQRQGGILEQMAHSVALRCRVSEVPTELTYDISGLGLGDVVHAGDLRLPSDCALHIKPDETIAVLLSPTVPFGEEPVAVLEDVSGPELTGEKQKSSAPAEVEE